MIKKMLLVVMVLSLFTLSGCKEEKTFKVGLSNSLSGDYSYVGNAALYGAQVAVEEINSSGGINGMQVELVIKDDQANPVKAVEVDNELLDDGVNIILGHGLSLVALESVNNIEGKNALFLSPSIGTDSLSNIKDNFIRNVATTLYEGRTITEALIEDNPSKILFIYNLDNLVLTQYHKQSFEAVMSENGYDSTKFETYGYHTNHPAEISTMESKISSGDFDSIMFVGSNVDAAPVINYIKSNELNIPIHLSSWASTGLIGRIESVDTSNIYAYFGFLESDEQEFIDFKESYKEKYKTDVNMITVNSYDMVYLLKRAVEYADSTDPTKVQDAILEIKDFDGILGDFSINEYGDCIKEHYQMIIIDGEYVRNED